MDWTIRTIVIFLVVYSGCFTYIMAQTGSPDLPSDDKNNEIRNLKESKIPDRFFAPDKAQHLMGSLISTVFIYKVFEGSADAGTRESRYLAGGITLSLGISKEIFDSKDPKNHFSWKDLIADIAGIGLGFIIINQP